MHVRFFFLSWPLNSSYQHKLDVCFPVLVSSGFSLIAEVLVLWFWHLLLYTYTLTFAYLQDLGLNLHHHLKMQPWRLKLHLPVPTSRLYNEMLTQLTPSFVCAFNVQFMKGCLGHVKTLSGLLILHSLVASLLILNFLTWGPAPWMWVATFYNH